MADLTRNARFTSLVAATERVIDVLATAGVDDAIKLMLRQRGWNSLQGHVRAVMPLAVWFVRAHPEHLDAVRRATRLGTPMHGGSSEARNRAVWRPIQRDLKALLTKQGNDVISVALASRTPTTAAEIAKTYLARDYGGGQTSGKAANTVFKRTLKLLAHVLPV